MTATTPPPGTVLLAGATGDLGGRILRNLVGLGATVRVLTRPETNTARITQLRSQGAEVIQTGYGDPVGLRRACTGVDCVVSAINGLDSVIVVAQARLLEAAAAAGVPRFIPSDFSIDYRGIRPRSNRNYSSVETSRRGWTQQKSGLRRSITAPLPTCSPGRHL